MPQPLTFEELVSRKKPATVTVPVALDPDLAGELEDARRARDLAAVKAEARPNDSDAQARLWETEEAYDRLMARMEEEGVVVHFVLRAIGRATYDALQDAHPPTQEQRNKAKRLGLDASGALAWNPETFPAALVAASLVEPKLSEAEMQALWADDNWNQAELSELFAAAVKVSGTRRTVELGKDSTRIRRSAPS